MSPAEFEAVVRRAMEELPEWVLGRIHNLEVLVEDAPTRDQDPEGAGLLGLYDGLSLPERGADYSGVMPDVVYIFRLPHLELGLPRQELEEEIRRTVWHELAHYFGIEDDHLDHIGWG
ncbi:MAG: metallopeptidase family protein [Gammaproteobacteria bacterium]